MAKYRFLRALTMMHHRFPGRPAISLLMATLILPGASLAQEQEPANDTDTAVIDSQGSLDAEQNLLDDRFLFYGDFRPAYVQNRRERREGNTTTNSFGQFRLRFRGSALLTEGVRIGARASWRCTTDVCGFDWYSDPAIPGGNGLNAGQATFDEFFAHFFRRDRFNLSLGRQQTRFVLRGGVFSRSLDRNDSNNTNITWTDGAQFSLAPRKGWSANLIWQRNSEDGSGSIRDDLLDFSSSAARNTWYLATENLTQWGPVVQRALGVTYMPDTLLVDGDTSGRRQNYWGVVGRMAARWPLGDSGMHIRSGFEIGYAPNTPTSAAANIDADVDGLAWNVVVSLMEFKPRHSIGFNFGSTGSGWLLSPNFDPNQNLAEIRYQWRTPGFLSLDIRIRHRREIHRQSDAVQKLDVVDGFVRLTWQFGRNI